MEKLNLKLAKELNKIAKNLVADALRKTPEYKVIEKYETQIDSNNVYGAYKALAKYFGDRKAEKALTLIEQLHDLQGHITMELLAVRKTYTAPLDDKMKRDKKLQQARTIYLEENR